MNSVFAVCMVAGHSVPVASTTELPEGWSIIPASVIPAPAGPNDQWEPGIWYENPDSETMILVCPEHTALVVRL